MKGTSVYDELTQKNTEDTKNTTTIGAAAIDETDLNSQLELNQLQNGAADQQLDGQFAGDEESEAEELLDGDEDEGEENFEDYGQEDELSEESEE